MSNPVLRFFRHVFFIVVAMAGLWCAGLVWFITLIPHWENNDTTSADVIVVLTGGSIRIEHGLQQLEEGKGKTLFITGVAKGVKHHELPQNNPRYSSIISTHRGQIELGFEARDTYGNAQEAARWLEKHKELKTLRLVTANYHMPRSLYEFRRALPADIRIIPDPVFPDQFKLAEWWKFPGTLRLILSEYHKYVGRILLGPPREKAV